LRPELKKPVDDGLEPWRRKLLQIEAEARGDLEKVTVRDISTSHAEKVGKVEKGVKVESGT